MLVLVTYDVSTTDAEGHSREHIIRGIPPVQPSDHQLSLQRSSTVVGIGRIDEPAFIGFFFLNVHADEPSISRFVALMNDPARLLRLTTAFNTSLY